VKNSSITRNSYCFATILFITALLTSHPVAAATYYVATTGSDGNPGTQAQPWLTLQKAANTVVAGDTVYIRGGTYSSNSIISLSRSGTSGSLITWKPEPSTGAPILRYTGTKLYDHAIIEGFGISYNRFEGLTFGGSSGSTQTDQAIKFFATNSPDFNATHSNTRGNQIVGNTFSNVGHNGIGGAVYGGIVALGGGAEDTLVDSNTFTNNYGMMIVDAGGYNNTISNNTMSGLLGVQFYGNTSYPPNAHGVWISATAATWSPGSTLKIGGYDLVQGNVIDGTGTNLEMSGIRCDAGSHNLTIQNNTVKNLGNVGDTGGIYMESRCMHNTITQNIVYNSRSNFAFSNASIGSTQYNTITNNDSYGGQIGFWLAYVGNSSFQNNISIANQYTQMAVSAMSVSLGGNVFSNNLYWKSGTSSVNLWNCAYNNSGTDNCSFSSANLSLSSWNTTSGETANKSADPLFVNPPSDFHLQAGSPAIAAGVGGVDMGAYPTATSSSITSPPTITAPFGSKILDGDAADWNGISSLPLGQVCPTCITPVASDLAANVRVGWDNTYLYALVEVSDNSVEVDVTAQIYENDGIEVMIDGLRDRTTTYGSDDHQIFVQADGLTAAAGHTPGDGKIIAAARQRIGGYTLEVAIRWDFIGGNPPVGNQLYGFDVAVNDRDNGVRVNQLFWKYAPNHWQDTSGFGDLGLLPAATTLVPPSNLSVQLY
jgi:cellulose/xylan binding protein with CBM9 domain/pectate lyase-like protein/parallel beta helix pectate lyase-like protein